MNCIHYTGSVTVSQRALSVKALYTLFVGIDFEFVRNMHKHTRPVGEVHNLCGM
jgi:hypothetical protein